MYFTKLQGLGNDFVLIDAREPRGCDWADLARKICRRRFGIGSDGLLLLLGSQTADFRMRMFNPDGSEAEACGNGLRCLVRYIAANDLNQRDDLCIETMAGIRQAKLLGQGSQALIKVSMGKPSFRPEDIPIANEASKGSLFDIMIGDYPLTAEGRDLKLNFVSMGNPHAVHFTTDPVAEFPLAALGPQVEKAALFPRGVNLEVVRMSGPGRCEMRVWERGAGETLACGSGACAAMVAARLHGLAGDNLELKLPGGTAEVSWDGQGEVWLTGPAEIVFTGEWPDEPVA
ncbi:MAG: diaminopimelate epimerase [Dehalococcoidia bacterium]|nr:diaminopimelate epimerase [Dehalococcoidia bacterium]